MWFFLEDGWPVMAGNKYGFLHRASVERSLLGTSTLHSSPAWVMFSLADAWSPASSSTSWLFFPVALSPTQNAFLAGVIPNDLSQIKYCGMPLNPRKLRHSRWKAGPGLILSICIALFLLHGSSSPNSLVLHSKHLKRTFTFPQLSSHLARIVTTSTDCPGCRREGKTLCVKNFKT